MLGHRWTADACEAKRRADIDATVQRLGALAALSHYETGEAVARKLAGDAFDRGHEATGRGMLAAAAYLRESARVLVERHA